MTTIEILAALLKDNEIASISEKQRGWLLSQAKREGIKTHNTGYEDFIYLVDCHYKIKSASIRVGGYGGTIGHRFTGRYNVYREYTIKFTSTGLTGVYMKTDIDYFRSQGHEFIIINQL